MESLSSKNKNVRDLLCAIDVFTKYARVKLLKDKGMLFNEKVNGSNRKPNYGLIKEESFNDDDILMYSTHSEVKSVITERFIKTLKYKIYKKMSAIDSKSDVSCLNKLVDHCNNTYSVIWL